jgi:hypothetical protein
LRSHLGSSALFTDLSAGELLPGDRRLTGVGDDAARRQFFTQEGYAQKALAPLPGSPAPVRPLLIACFSAVLPAIVRAQFKRTLQPCVYRVIGGFKCQEELSLLHHDIDRSGGPQGQVMDWIGQNGLARHQGKADPLGERGEQQLALHQGQVHPDADARPCAKWQVRITRKPFLPFGCEALGIKPLRVREVFRLAQSFPGISQQMRSNRFLIIAGILVTVARWSTRS